MARWVWRELQWVLYRYWQGSGILETEQSDMKYEKEHEVG